jgi:predicted amidohydrolase YtcJ
MRRWMSMSVAAVLLAAMPHAQQPAADVILTGGKIITVDERFTIAQAVAVRGERIVAVGTNQEIARLAGPKTRRIDLRGRAVLPGLIDNHAHFMEEGVLWTDELRLDGIDTRKQAIAMMRAKAASIPPDRWIYTLGGWSHDQFTDDPRPFTREELDAIVSTHPVLLQFTRAETYVNSKAVEAIGLEQMKEPWIRRDASGRSTGVIDAAGAGAASAAIPKPDQRNFESNSMAMIRELNASGLTASGGPCPEDVLPRYKEWAQQGKLNKRFYCLVSVPMGNSAQRVTEQLPKIAELKLFQGDLWIDSFAYGEGFYGPAGDNMVAPKATQRPDDFVQWGRIAREIARAGLPIHAHTTLEGTADGFLDQIEQINKEYPVRNLRWAFIHADQLNASHLARMKKLGMYVAVQPRPTIMGGIFHRAHGDRAYSTPNMRLIQDSGITWGLGTDAYEVNQYRPFTTLWFAVTGKMVGGTVVNRQTVSREEALIAHTRKNAYLVLQEDNMGAIQPGKLADLIVIDRDYLTVPADRIKDITSVLTMVGGRIVYEAATQTSSMR